MAEYVKVNLSDMLSELGESEVKVILSSFICPLNQDVENFIKHKAIEFSKQNLAKTHLVFYNPENGEKMDLVGYFTISSKYICIGHDVLSKNMMKKVSKYGKFDSVLKKYVIPAPLIAQLGKNYAEGNDTLISGSELLAMACEKIKYIQKEIGGKITYLECEDKAALISFYSKNGFTAFGKRRLDRDETDLHGDYLIQLLKYIR